MALLKNDYGKLAAQAEAQLADATEDEAKKILADATENAPEDTGDLKRSGYIDPISRYEYAVGFGVPYAGHVEHGHHTRSGSFVPGQFYLKRAVEAHRNGFPRALQNALWPGGQLG